LLFGPSFDAKRAGTEQTEYGQQRRHHPTPGRGRRIAQDFDFWFQYGHLLGSHNFSLAP
jgi:hypothetical protein